jgi:hypothetical protein
MRIAEQMPEHAHDKRGHGTDKSQTVRDTTLTGHEIPKNAIRGGPPQSNPPPLEGRARRTFPLRADRMVGLGYAEELSRGTVHKSPKIRTDALAEERPVFVKRADLFIPEDIPDRTR